MEDSFNSTNLDGVALIAAERYRQIQAEGYSAEHDDTHDGDEMALAAAVYAVPDRERSMRGFWSLRLWPWGWRWFKPAPDDRIRELEKAGALIAAEIDRLLRQKAPSVQGGNEKV